MADDLTPDADPTAGLTPAQETEVRRLLAAARHDEPAPEAVVARLDAALAQLRDERDAARDPSADPTRDAEKAERAAAAARLTEPVTAPVVDLAARRRRRWTQALVAAAAVVVVGVAAPNVLSGLGGGMGSNESAGGDAGTAVEEGTDPAAESEDGAGRQAPTEDAGPQAVVPTDGEVPRVDAQGFAADAERLRRTDSVLGALRSNEQDQKFLSGTCAPQLSKAARALEVRYQKQRALLVYSELDGDRELAELYLCDQPEPVATATVPAPE